MVLAKTCVLCLLLVGGMVVATAGCDSEPGEWQSPASGTTHRDASPAQAYGEQDHRGDASQSDRGLWSWIIGKAGWAGNPAPGAESETDSAPENCMGYSVNRMPFFGDLHIHTARSYDAQGFFDYDHPNGPDEAYRFAKGEAVKLLPGENGQTLFHRLDRPLDFAAVTDHSEFFAETSICTDPNSRGYRSPSCKAYRGDGALAGGLKDSGGPLSVVADLLVFGVQLMLPKPAGTLLCKFRPLLCKKTRNEVWQEMQTVADEHYDQSESCQFTTFIGYEWTGKPWANNLHRNVLFRNSHVPKNPVSYLDEPRPDRLWDALENECNNSGTGCQALAIPHNSNISGGLMFVPQLHNKLGFPNGPKYSAYKSAQRSRLEPLVEVLQHKGASECLVSSFNGLGSSDEECNFEQLARDVCQGTEDDSETCIPQCEMWNIDPVAGQASLCISAAGYVRPALRTGLLEQDRSGANPFKFGFIASTDTHNGLSGAVEEDVWPGHSGGNDNSAEKRLYPLLNPEKTGPEGFLETLLQLAGPNAVKYTNPGGYAVVWAEQNRRDNIFDAMLRREAYATSGTRITLRFFAGDYPANSCSAYELAELGYKKGVPMGGELWEWDDSPQFIIAAWQDPGVPEQPERGIPEKPGARLQQIQVVKVWTDNGQSYEKVYRAVAGQEGLGSVNLNTGELSGDGYPSLCTVWNDPDFNGKQRAAYYARVLEVPTLRWSRLLCNDLASQSSDVDCRVLDGYLPPTIRERAWSSPIYYNPSEPSDNGQSQ